MTLPHAKRLLEEEIKKQDELREQFEWSMLNSFGGKKFYRESMERAERELSELEAELRYIEELEKKEG